MTNEVTLLPCPFCGRSDTTRYGRSSEFHEDCDGGDGGNDDYFAVFCDASEPRGLGGCGASGGFAKTYEEAAGRWNRRPAVEPKAPRVEQLFKHTGNGRLYRLWGDVSDCSGEADDEKRMAIYSHHDDSEPKFAREMSEFRLFFKPIEQL